MTVVGVHDAVQQLMTSEAACWQAANGLSWLQRFALSGLTSWLQEDGGRRQEAGGDEGEVRQDRNTERELIQDHQGPEICLTFLSLSLSLSKQTL